MQISEYNASKLITRTIAELDLMHLIKFTDFTVCDADTGDNIPRRTITIELLVPEPKKTFEDREVEFARKYNLR